MTLEERILGENPTPAQQQRLRDLCHSALRSSTSGRELLSVLNNAVPPMLSGFTFTSDPVQAAYWEGMREVSAFLFRWSETPVPAAEIQQTTTSKQHGKKAR